MLWALARGTWRCRKGPDVMIDVQILAQVRSEGDELRIDGRGVVKIAAQMHSRSIPRQNWELSVREAGWAGAAVRTLSR